MSDNSSRLGLPYIQAAQAQKHVTHNEALRVLDALVQASVVSKDVTVPPSLPVDGEAYVVPAGALGAWLGHEGSLAVWEDNAWFFYEPSEGWTIWVDDLDALWSYDGVSWVATAPPESWQNQPMLGINTTADATNRLAVSAPATLLTNEGAGHQLKINKASDGDTASLLFQSNWAGHAEMGLAGGTDFSIKTSDGVTWFSAIQCASANGRVSFPNGIGGLIEVYDTGRSVFLGEGAGANDDLSDNQNTFVGYYSGQATTVGDSNTAVGVNSLLSNTSGNNNTSLGANALRETNTGNNNTAVGVNSLRANSTGNANAALGAYCLNSNTTGGNNAALGGYALYENESGEQNVAVGFSALRMNLGGDNNSALGVNALRFTTTGANNTAYSNCAGLGYDTRVSGSNQVQLGDSGTTTYAYGAVQDRSDARDKADVRDTLLGLDFITRLRPVDFRWDMRDDYFDEVEETDLETGEVVTKLVKVKKDGSCKRGRYHHGVIAQEVAAVLKETGLDFGGYQDHNYSGNGEDVLSIGYTEFIAPLIRAVQELAAEVAALKAKV